jgi:hypothetical protein
VPLCAQRKVATATIPHARGGAVSHPANGRDHQGQARGAEGRTSWRDTGEVPQAGGGAHERLLRISTLSANRLEYIEAQRVKAQETADREWTLWMKPAARACARGCRMGPARWTGGTLVDSSRRVLTPEQEQERPTMFADARPRPADSVAATCAAGGAQKQVVGQAAPASLWWHRRAPGGSGEEVDLQQSVTASAEDEQPSGGRPCPARN